MLSVDLVFHVVTVHLCELELFCDSLFGGSVQAAFFSGGRGGPLGPRAKIPFGFCGA